MSAKMTPKQNNISPRLKAVEEKSPTSSQLVAT
jgi:hypothetical protein